MTATGVGVGMATHAASLPGPWEGHRTPLSHVRRGITMGPSSKALVSVSNDEAWAWVMGDGRGGQ
jgi:hypothetical protein